MIRLELPEDEYQSLVLTKAVYTYVKESIFSNDEERLIQEAIRYLHTKYSREELVNRISIYTMSKDIDAGGEKNIC